MERRLFVKNASIFASGVLVFSSAKTFAENQDKKTTNLDFTPFSSTKKIVVQGSILDSKTHLAVAATIVAKTKRNRFFAVKKSIESTNGSYLLQSGFADSENKSEKIEVQITAPGYKTYTGFLNLSSNECRIHSDVWQYNPDFKSDYCPKDTNSENELRSEYNFYLVK
jgi:hypothetical protein